MNNQNEDKWLQPLKNRPDLEPSPLFVEKVRNKFQEKQMTKRNFSGLKMWIPLTMAVMLFSVITVSFIMDNQQQEENTVQTGEQTNTVNPDINSLLAMNSVYQEIYNSVYKVTELEEASKLVVHFFEALHVEDEEYLKNNVEFVANPEKEVTVLLDYYEGIDISTINILSITESQTDQSVEIVFSYEQDNEETLHHIFVNFMDDGKVEIYAPLDEYVPEVKNDLELNDQERTAYEQFKSEHNPEALRGLEPISVAKIYIQANADGDQESSYALYTTREDRIMWSLEEDKKYWEEEGTRDAETYKKPFFGLGSGTFHQTSDYEGYISFPNQNGEMGFQMLKDENGIWKVSFMPIQ
jgi:hypothetical protein